MKQKNLLSLRNKIDLLDASIIKKLAARQKLSRQIGRLKSASGQKIVDPKRETQQKTQYKKLALQYQLDADFLLKIFKLIIAHSRRLQKHGS